MWCYMMVEFELLVKAGYEHNLILLFTKLHLFKSEIGEQSGRKLPTSAQR